MLSWFCFCPHTRALARNNAPKEANPGDGDMPTHAQQASATRLTPAMTCVSRGRDIKPRLRAIEFRMMMFSLRAPAIPPSLTRQVRKPEVWARRSHWWAGLGEQEYQYVSRYSRFGKRPHGCGGGRSLRLHEGRVSIFGVSCQRTSCPTRYNFN